MLNFGNYEDCSEINCLCEYTPCEHTNEILKKYGSPVYGSESLLFKIINIQLQYQELILKDLCEKDLSLKAIAEASGYLSCIQPLVDNDCEDICGSSYRVYTLSECRNCIDFTFSDEHYLNVIKSLQYMKYPNRNNYEQIADIFGWELIYSNTGINFVVGSSPANYSSFFAMLPVPMGDSLRLLAPC